MYLSSQLLKRTINFIFDGIQLFIQKYFIYFEIINFQIDNLFG